MLQIKRNLFMLCGRLIYCVETRCTKDKTLNSIISVKAGYADSGAEKEAEAEVR